VLRLLRRAAELQQHPLGRDALILRAHHLGPRLYHFLLQILLVLVDVGDARANFARVARARLHQLLFGLVQRLLEAFPAVLVLPALLVELVFHFVVALHDARERAQQVFVAAQDEVAMVLIEGLLPVARALLAGLLPRALRFPEQHLSAHQVGLDVALAFLALLVQFGSLGRFLQLLLGGNVAFDQVPVVRYAPVALAAPLQQVRLLAGQDGARLPTSILR